MSAFSVDPAPLDTTSSANHLTVLSQLFEEQADLVPDRVAVEFNGRCLTYRELDGLANQLAWHLQTLGVGPEMCVAFWLPRSSHVYVTLLGILKSGGAYVPIDAEYPADRVDYIVEDSNSRILITTAELAPQLPNYTGTIITLDAKLSVISDDPATRIPFPSDAFKSDQLCYVIYTSGSTGKPKGVEIEHRNVMHLVRTEAKRFAIQPEDRVYQGFSIAFDASVEELWLAWCAGATLVAANAELVHAGPDLPRLLTELRITVLSCVPTLLAMMEDDLPSVRLLIVGGEVCSRDLVDRWCRPERRMFNTYGPTEATVIATWTECDPEKPITIGKPLPGYSAFIMDESRNCLPVGEPGELYLGGAGLARGYMGRSDLTKDRFVNVTIPSIDSKPLRLYRTGDLAQWTSDGNLQFLGRADGQIKLRGFRVELSEIESELQRCPGVRAAAAAVREDIPGVQQLIAYVVPRSSTGIDEEQIKAHLRLVLPPYMIPALVETIEQLPTLTSGKVDRKQLPAPLPRTTSHLSHTASEWQPQDNIEIQLAAAWNELFSTRVEPNDDFFIDLGGHSLLAARMISSMRKLPDFTDLSMLDVYHHPTLMKLAKAIRIRRHEAVALAASTAAPPPHPVHRTTQFQYLLCSLAQACGLYFVIGFFSLQWLAPYLTYTFMLDAGKVQIDAAMISLATIVLLYPVMLGLSIVIKWVVIGRIKPGRYPLWGSYYLRWWFVQAIRNIVPTAYLTGTPLLALYYRMMGATIGPNVHLGDDGAQAFDLLTIGEDSCLGADSHFSGATVENGWLILGPIHVGRRCFVGTRTVLSPHSRMEDDTELDDLSLLPPHSTIPAGERWSGSPPRHIDKTTTSDSSQTRIRPSFIRRLTFGWLFVLGTMIYPLLPMAAFFPGMILMIHLNYIDDDYSYLVLSPLVATSFVVLISIEIAVIKWLLLGRVRPGSYPLYSGFYFRKWFVDRLMNLSLDVIGPLYSTLFFAPWFRMLGASIGHRTEVSTASYVSPDCLQIGDESFVADSVSLGAAQVKDGMMTIDDIQIGSGSFVGNSALVPIGASIPDDSLIGVLSTTPRQEMTAGSSWLGSPSFFLPQRQVSTEFSREKTFRPSRAMRGLRAFHEFFRITLPSTLFLIFTNILLSAVLVMHGHIPDWQIVLLFPLLYFKTCCSAALVMIGLKWLLMRSYRPCERPLWSSFVWQTEIVTSMLENFAKPYFLGLLVGTPYVCWFFRLLGAKIGRRVFLDSTEMTEFDLVQIGNDVAINLDCTLQTHLFEDRVMKMSNIRIDDDCHLGAMSVVLYDTHIGKGASLGDLSLLMKGESLPEQTTWVGIPCKTTHAR